MKISDRNLIIGLKKTIDHYLEFDSDLLFRFGDVRIFGGAIRDSISRNKINDIDILINPNKFDYLHDLIIRNGYIFNDKLVTSGTFSMYKEMQIIYEPKTFINKQGRIIQLIRPNTNMIDYEQAFDYLVSNVDLTPCALSYNGNILVEHVSNAFLHVKYMGFRVNKNAKMYSYNRCHIRKDKLSKIGWTNLDSDTTKSNNILNSINREIKIKVII